VKTTKAAAAARGFRQFVVFGTQASNRPGTKSGGPIRQFAAAQGRLQPGDSGPGRPPIIMVKKDQLRQEE